VNGVPFPVKYIDGAGIRIVADAVSESWGDIEITVTEIPGWSSGFVYRGEIAFTAYSIGIEVQEKPWGGDWDGPEDADDRVVDVDSDGNEIRRNWYHLWTVNDNAIRADVAPQFLAEIVDDTNFSVERVGTTGPGILPVGKFIPPKTPPPLPDGQPEWKNIFPGVQTYFGVRAIIHFDPATACTCSDACSCSRACCHSLIGTQNVVDIAIQKPEFISDADRLAEPQITRENYKDYLTFRAMERGVTPFGANHDHYESYIDRSAPSGTALAMRTPIFAAPRRAVKYSFVIMNELGQELYLHRNANNVWWSFTKQNSGDDPMFVIDPDTGVIRTGTDFAKVKDFTRAFLLWIRAYSPSKPAEHDVANVMVGTLELNIDSDNNNGHLGLPHRTAIERLLQNDDHALGKLILPSTQIHARTPLCLYLPEGLDRNDESFKIGFTFDWHPGELGSVGVHTRQYANTPGNISIGNGDKRTLADLDYSMGNGIITLYLAGMPPRTGYQTKTEVDAQTEAPSRKITATLYLDGQSVAKDTIKYLVANRTPFSYYYEHYFDGVAPKMPNEPLRAAIAADLVYGPTSSKTFGMKWLGFEELGELGVSNEVRSLLLQSEPGHIKARLYRDGVTGKFILAFAGSDDFGDVIENIWQAAGNPPSKFVSQYRDAMRIANELRGIFGEGSQAISITGHSLGGGLASAAYCISGFTTYTFNAAGLHRNTIAHYNGVDANIRATALERYDAAYNTNVHGNITAYYVDYDLLSFIQDYTPLVNALGRRVKLNSGKAVQMALASLSSLVVFLPVLGKPGLFASLAWRTAIMIECHRMPAVYHGKLAGKNLL